MTRSTHRLTLSGLTADDVAHYMTAACGGAAARDTVDAILHATRGNAFFVTEVVQLLQARGPLDAASIRGAILELPAGVQEVIHRRIAPLSAACRHLLAAAAVIGREFEVGVLARATGLGGRARKAGSDAERAPLNVTRAVRKVVRKIQADCPVLGVHLERSVQTGLFCAYQPDPTFHVD